MSLIDDDTRAQLSALFSSESDDFVTLLETAGLNPMTDLRGGDFTGTDFGEADIADWDLRGTDLFCADLSKVKNIVLAIFDAETNFTNTKLPEGVTEIDLY